MTIQPGFLSFFSPFFFLLHFQLWCELVLFKVINERLFIMSKYTLLQQKMSAHPTLCIDTALQPCDDDHSVWKKKKK
jgi:hypothetical protein